MGMVYNCQESYTRGFVTVAIAIKTKDCTAENYLLGNKRGHVSGGLFYGVQEDLHLGKFRHCS